MNAATQLVALWMERDSRYQTRRVAGMTENEQRIIREWRSREVDALPADDREAASRLLRDWAPPNMGTR